MSETGARSDDKRVAKYVYAIGNSEGVTPGTDPWHAECARAVMAVADAEMAVLWTDLERHEAELERLTRSLSMRERLLRDAEAANRAHDAQDARAEAAEAKVARVEALLDGAPTVAISAGGGNLVRRVQMVPAEELRAALDADA